MKNTIDLTKISSKLVTSKWMLPASNYAALCKLVETYMERGYDGQIPEIPHIDEGEYASSEEYPIAVIGVGGVLAKGVSEAEAFLLGMVDVDEISEALDKAAADPTVKEIYLSFSSPGGETVGIEELGRKIKDIDENIKPIYGWTETQAASAAYWLLSQCRKIGMTPTSQVGSVGVYSLVGNITEQMKQQGIDIEIFSSGKYKMIGHDFRTLTDVERDILQKDVEKQHEKFKKVILEKRPNINPEDFEGLSFEGEDALSKGFTDYVTDSFAEFLGITTK